LLFDVGFAAFERRQFLFDTLHFTFLLIGEFVGARCCAFGGGSRFGRTLLCLLFELRVAQGSPFEKIGVGTGKIFYLSATLENEQVFGHLIHKIAVVRHHHNAPSEVLEILFEYLQGCDVEVVGRLVENQEVGVLHQDSAEV